MRFRDPLLRQARRHLVSAWMFFSVLPGVEPKTPTTVDKHASELDLGCASYKEAIDWVSIKVGVKAFVADPEGRHAFMEDLLKLERGQRISDCYIGLCCLGYIALLHMPPEKRALAMRDTLFGSVPMHEQIPLSYWDTIASGWPVFGLLDLVANEVRQDEITRAPPEAADGCCDGITRKEDRNFFVSLHTHLASGTAVPASTSLAYLAGSPNRCSWGKGAAYIALAERTLLSQTSGSEQSAKELMVLGEQQLDRCAPGRNITVYEHMLSEWPFWRLLGRVESKSFVRTPSQWLRRPQRYHAPSLSQTARVRTTNSRAADPDVGDKTVTQHLVESDPCLTRDVHVAFSGDQGHVEGLLAALNSVIHNAATPERICIHVFVQEGDETFFRGAFSCSFGDKVKAIPLPHSRRDVFLLRGTILQFEVFAPSDIMTSYFGVEDSVTLETGNLNAPHNYIRFHLANWIPPGAVPKLIYLDTDVIVLGDVCELHDTSFHTSETFASGSDDVVAAVPRFDLPLSVYLKALSPRMPAWLPSSYPSFNAGVMVIQMREWQRTNITGSVDRWSRLNHARELWRHGSQPPLLVVLYDKFHRLDWRWNVDGLGSREKRFASASDIAEAKILHWSGPLKPWSKNGLHKELWSPYAVHCWES